MSKNLNILVCPLNWGLGHATRCVPVISELIESGHQVTLGGDGPGLFLLKNKFPALNQIVIPSTEIRYGKGILFIPTLLSQMPAFLRNIKTEHRLLNEILKKQSFDMVISDNRYGLYNESTRNVIITHQLMVKLPRIISFAEALLHDFIDRRLSYFDHIIVPDNAGTDNFSGDLSHKFQTGKKVSFTGIISRFSCAQIKEETEKKYDVLFINSGPEPHRTTLENIIISQLKNSGSTAAILRGLPETIDHQTVDHIDFFTHAHDDDFLKLVAQSRYIIARGGYSTIMDLLALNRKAVLIPTPGQTEQEYLAKHLHKNGMFVFERQKEFSLKNALEKLSLLNGTHKISGKTLLKETLGKITA